MFPPIFTNDVTGFRNSIGSLGISLPCCLASDLHNVISTIYNIVTMA